MDYTNDEFIRDLRQLINDVENGIKPTEELIYVNNTLQNGVIEAFWEGKMPREKMEKILYGE